MHITPVSTDLIGELNPTPYFKEHLQEYENEFLDAACALGYPRELWPSGEQLLTFPIHMAKKTGKLPDTIPTTQPINRTNYTGPKPHELVLHNFNHQFGFASKAVFVITEGEDWWPHARSFLAHDANSWMLYCLYSCALKNKDVLIEPKKRGRPRNEAAHAVKAERSTRYQEWLAECEAYRVRHNELKDAYLKALAEYTAYKEQGAPKWIP